jgi:hypothetical protein
MIRVQVADRIPTRKNTATEWLGGSPRLHVLWLPLVRLRYCALVRTTLDISDEAYHLAKAIARDQNRSLAQVVSDLILQSAKGANGADIAMSGYGFPSFRCTRPVTSEDVNALDDGE